MKKLLTILITSLTVTLSLVSGADAAWYEVTGSSAIVATEDQAKIHALEDAVYKAARFSGADIGSVSNLFPLLNTKKDEFLFTNHEVRYIWVEQVGKENGIMYVKARIDIYPSARGCHFDQYKKTFLVSNFDIENPQQAVMGQLYDLGTDFARVLNRQIDQTSQSFVSVGTTDYRLDGHSPSRLEMIAEDKGAQYLVSGEITDLSATANSDDTINRQFSMNVRVYDGKTGNEVMQRKYREVARWPFPKTSQVDTRSARFWASAYGDMLLRVSRNMMLDFEAELSCKITLPEVIAKFGNTVTMNLGRIHGVKAGDTLRLWHTGSFIDQRGISRTKVTQSNITLTVTRVYQDNAELKIDQPTLADSIQIGDVMRKINEDKTSTNRPPHRKDGDHMSKQTENQN
ncbi:flagellar assembly protein FlgT [Vibrio salinus]|uniref:flagellar assembly protein FlgT n=1 Tax=Vibrio salinus TaxID=2899784 RepID=UPI001E40ECF5|nr:flagellar assembly protein FlgT [Vibrio salinus]MCE0494432.1 flagellar assembly protein FlgT [Vibrio salinus]